MERPYPPQMHPYSYSQDLYPVFYPSHDLSLEMRELQHVADPYRQHFYPSHSSYDPHFDPMFRSHEEISSSSTRSTSVQEPTVSFESAPRSDSVVEEFFSITSSSDSSSLPQLADSLPSTVPVSFSESTSYLAQTVEGIISLILPRPLCLLLKKNLLLSPSHLFQVLLFLPLNLSSTTTEEDPRKPRQLFFPLSIN